MNLLVKPPKSTKCCSPMTYLQRPTSTLDSSILSNSVSPRMTVECMAQRSFKHVTVTLWSIAILATSVVSAVAAQAADVDTKSHAAVKPATLEWSRLTTTQRQALQPLASSWPSLSEVQKKKWITLSHNYASLTPANQQKLHQRMVEWAALTPKQRTLARLNFSQTQQVTPEDKAERWEIYQSLTPEQKKALAASVPKLPLAPKVAKPATPTRVTSIVRPASAALAASAPR
ncbi:MAG: hypothetical protein COW02_16875 [Comamonadaceae bacterium CG12_big_fil_rev_8_21_14_0_65_59_15]|nr:MAG: hypothetical protein COW02_16875 [Comamonadaceae bacterium CG12_big_fil_rev_8_21_14_0_65_59_15]